jgi:O-antigen/teichoic acid export membrane protein
VLYRKDKQRLQAVLVVFIIFCVLIGGSIGIYLVINWLMEVIFGAQQPGNNLRRIVDFCVNTIFIITFIVTTYIWLIKGRFRK